MVYHVLIEDDWGIKNIIDLNIADLLVVIKAYDKGVENFFITGQKYIIENIRKIKIYRSPEKYIHYSEILNPIKGAFIINTFLSNEKSITEFGFGFFAEDLTGRLIKGGFGERLKYYEFDEDKKALMIIEAIESLKIKSNENLFPFESITNELTYPLDINEVAFICKSFEEKGLGKKMQIGMSQGFFYKDELFQYKYDSRFKLKKAETISKSNINSIETLNNNYEVDIAFITALLDDELKYIAPYIENKKQIDSDSVKLIEIGTLINKPTLKILLTSLLKTGMIDAGITATEVILKYKPKIIIMTGVCGGRQDEKYQLTDIVVANSVYTFHKGKETSTAFEPEWEGVEINGKLIQLIERDKDSLKSKLQNVKNIHFGPMACSNHIINADGKFEQVLKNKDRKTVALEMEGYGIARACQITNNGNTKCLIIKSYPPEQLPISHIHAFSY